MAIFRQKKDHRPVLASCVAGLALLVIGFVNTFWGNDPFFGLMIVFASGLYLWPVLVAGAHHLQSKRVVIAKFILFFVLLWASLGVGELGDKVDLMQSSFPMPNITGI